MKNPIDRIDSFLVEVPGKIKKMPEKELSSRPSLNKWSKKEILGHLCDSAVNNYNRFIRIQFEASPFKIASYDQNNWVRINDYQNLTIEEILTKWIFFNEEILKLLQRVAIEKYSLKCRIEDGTIHDFKWLVHDYVDHMEYHLNQILNESLNKQT